MIPEINTAPGRDANLCTAGTSPVPWSAAFLGEAGTNEITMDPGAFLILLGHRIVLED